MHSYPGVVLVEDFLVTRPVCEDMHLEVACFTCDGGSDIWFISSACNLVIGIGLDCYYIYS